MQKKILSTAILLALGGMSINVWADIDLDACTGTRIFAEELKAGDDSAGRSQITYPATTIANELGVGLAANNTDYYIRYMLDGATFSGAPLDGTVTLTSGSASLFSGGTAGTTSAVFNIDSGSNPITSTTAVTFAVPAGAIVPGASATSVGITYALFFGPPNANSLPVDPPGEKSCDILDYQPGISFVVDNTQTHTATVDSAFVNLRAFNPNPITAYLADITLGVNEPASPNTASDGIFDVDGVDLTSSGPEAILTTSTTITATGDFSARGTVWLQNASCSTTAPTVSAAPNTLIGVISGTGTSAIATFGSTTSPVNTGPDSGTWALCYQSNSSSPFQSSSYTVTLNDAVYSDYDPAAINVVDKPAGSISRDGTQLFASTVIKSTTASRINCVNNGDEDAPIMDVQLFFSDAVTSYTTGALYDSIMAGTEVIPAHGRRPLQLKNLVTDIQPISQSVYGIGLTIGAEYSNIKCSYQYVDVSGIPVFVNMERDANTMCDMGLCGGP